MLFGSLLSAGLTSDNCNCDSYIVPVLDELLPALY